MTNGTKIYDQIDITSGFSRDAAGNIATTDGASLGLGIHLGAYGNLIFPVLVEGKNYFFWDIDGNGMANSLENVSINWLESEFAAAGLNNSEISDANRTWTINGTAVRLPTHGDPTDGGMVSTVVNKPGTAATNTDYYATTTNSNPTYDDLLAIWDQFNGTGTGTGYAGVPPGWLGNVWSSTVTNTGSHAHGVLNTGSVLNALGDQYAYYVALEVL